ncbi:MAG: hypothetical protein K2M17_05455 [Bacilli bacterium]|nr:hypothetical protein [Bacilli bacterium]
MKKMNNRGTSLVELIISVFLISVVLIFMFRLLVDINDEIVNDTYAKDNQVNRAEILRFVETDLNKEVLVGITSTGSTSSRLVINFTFKNSKSSQLTATGDTFVYTNVAGETKKWTMKNCTIYTKKAMVSVTPDDYRNMFAMNIHIEVHTGNDLNRELQKSGSKIVASNNNLDDITLSYIGYKSVDGVDGITSGQLNSIVVKRCLGYGC